MQIAVRELKSRLSQVLAQARAGEPVEVRSHNVPIARIVGIPVTANDSLRQLASRGAITWSGRKPELVPPVPMDAGGKSVSALVIEDRG